MSTSLGNGTWSQRRGRGSRSQNKLRKNKGQRKISGRTIIKGKRETAVNHKKKQNEAEKQIGVSP
jgi:hypothetical protein